MDKDKQGLSLEDDKSPNQIKPKSVLTPPSQPLPKGLNKNPTNKKSDSNPTL